MTASLVSFATSRVNCVSRFLQFDCKVTHQRFAILNCALKLANFSAGAADQFQGVADGIKAFLGGLLRQPFLLQLALKTEVGFGLLTGLSNRFAEGVSFKSGLTSFLPGVLDRPARFLESLLMFEPLLPLGGGGIVFRFQCEDRRRLLAGAWLAAFGEIGLITFFEQLFQEGAALAGQLHAQRGAEILGGAGRKRIQVERALRRPQDFSQPPVLVFG